MSYSWDSVAWFVVAGICIAFSFIHFAVWCMQSHGQFGAVGNGLAPGTLEVSPFLPADKQANLACSVLAISLAAILVIEVLLMNTQTPVEFGDVLRWIHIPFFTLYVSALVFTRAYFRGGRMWLLYAGVLLRFIGLVLNFLVDPNINYSSISSLKQVETFGGNLVSVAIGVRNPLLTIMELGSLIALIFIIDALITCWRRGGKIDRRRAIIVGTSLFASASYIIVRSALIHAGVINTVYQLGIPFLIFFAAISFEFGADVIRSVRIASQLQASEASLRLSEQRMDEASAAANLGMWEWNSTQDDIWATPQCRELYGFNTDEKLNFARLAEVLHPEDRDEWQIQVGHLLEEGGNYERSHRVIRPDGSIRWIGVRGLALEDNGKGMVIRGVSMDITERKRTEAELEQQRNELAHLSRVTMLSELSGSMAHELNQPLTAILSNAQAALRFIANDAGKLDEVQEILKDIISDDRRAGEIIQSLRVLLKKGERKNEALDINAAVQSVLRLTRSDLLNSSIVLSTDLTPDLPSLIGDSVQLQQVLLNLVVNACDAMKGNPVADRQLVVRTRLAADEHIEVCVEDQGEGIPEDKLELVFSPFYTTKNEGLGLGLAVCRQIITAHGGRLWAEKNPVKGASFIFTVQFDSGVVT